MTTINEVVYYFVIHTSARMGKNGGQAVSAREGQGQLEKAYGMFLLDMRCTYTHNELVASLDAGLSIENISD